MGKCDIKVGGTTPSATDYGDSCILEHPYLLYVNGFKFLIPAGTAVEQSYFRTSTEFTLNNGAIITDGCKEHILKAGSKILIGEELIGTRIWLDSIRFSNEYDARDFVENFQWGQCKPDRWPVTSRLKDGTVTICPGFTTNGRNTAFEYGGINISAAATSKAGTYPNGLRWLELAVGSSINGVKVTNQTRIVFTSEGLLVQSNGDFVCPIIQITVAGGASCFVSDARNFIIDKLKYDIKVAGYPFKKGGEAIIIDGRPVAGTFGADVIIKGVPFLVPKGTKFWISYPSDNTSALSAAIYLTVPRDISFIDAGSQREISAIEGQTLVFKGGLLLDLLN